MTYRDDLAAAQARADALERENVRLRDENAELEEKEKAARVALERRDSEPVELEHVPASVLEKRRVHSVGILMVAGFAAAGIGGVLVGPVVAVIGIATLFAGFVVLQVRGE